jgi:predicted HicB family RNase H-like nuclease
MPYNDKEKERTMKYARENIKRIPLDVPLKDYAGIKASAEAAGQGVNTYIKQAIRERQEREGSNVNPD